MDPLTSTRIRYFLLGLASGLILLALTGADFVDQQPTLGFGRYQLSSWATSFGKDSGALGAFVIDTVSGETKTVYSRIYGNPPDTRIIKNDLKKPFSAIR